MAKEQVPLQNIVYEAKRDGIVVNQGQEPGKEVLDRILSRLEDLKARMRNMEGH